MINNEYMRISTQEDTTAGWFVDRVDELEIEIYRGNKRIAELEKELAETKKKLSHALERESYWGQLGMKNTRA